MKNNTLIDRTYAVAKTVHHAMAGSIDYSLRNSAHAQLRIGSLMAGKKEPGNRIHLFYSPTSQCRDFFVFLLLHDQKPQLSFNMTLMASFARFFKNNRQPFRPEHSKKRSSRPDQHYWRCNNGAPVCITGASNSGGFGANALPRTAVLGRTHVPLQRSPAKAASRFFKNATSAMLSASMAGSHFRGVSQGTRPRLQRMAICCAFARTDPRYGYRPSGPASRIPECGNQISQCRPPDQTQCALPRPIHSALAAWIFRSARRTRLAAPDQQSCQACSKLRSIEQGGRFRPTQSKSRGMGQQRDNA